MSTPIAPLVLPERGLAPRVVAPEVVAAALPGPGRERLAKGPVLVVTTGQQPGLFTGPLYTIYKALSAVALARRLERAWNTPVVPVFWVAGDDHDFAEANHAWVLDTEGEPVEIRLRERAADAPLVPLAREPSGPEVGAALERLRSATPDTEFKASVLAWLEAAYRADATLADACAEALQALLGATGLVVLRAHDPALKRVAAPWVLRGLSITLPDGHTPVMVDAGLGRDRLRPDGKGDAFVTRRSGERFTRSMLEGMARDHPERLSPNVLLRPVVEAALFPTVAYVGGPAELGYLPQAAPLYEALGVARQAAVPRWSGVLIDAKVDKLIAKHGLTLADLDGQEGALEARLVREALPPEAEARFAELRRVLEEQFERLGEAVAKVDPTLARPIQSSKNNALAGTQEIEKKLLATLKRENETLVRKVSRARAAVFPHGEPQERVLTLASFAIRYGPTLVAELELEVARWADPS
ncbi:MAG TPA: bacillithiol biosynthesis BshC [Gemmatimonadales bacterium]|nr:bacillithiol biosynthesis BshC [Gemmatimonadales bacterium]